MQETSRRRFLAISAAASASLLAGSPARASQIEHWRGVAMGAPASISLRHPESARLILRARGEIERLEGIFSLFRPDSALSRLNAEGHLHAPPFELLEVLGLCATLHRASAGVFDPTIQPLWACYGEHHARNTAPSETALHAALARVGWEHLRFDTDQITFLRPDMALTLNGIAQGYIADRVSAVLQGEGLRNVLVNTGEFRALGGHPEGGAWNIGLQNVAQDMLATVTLQDAALASSAPLGTAFDQAGSVGHILDPRTGAPATGGWQLASVIAPSAALADGLSTALCLMSRPQALSLMAQFPQARLAWLG